MLASAKRLASTLLLGSTVVVVSAASGHRLKDLPLKRLAHRSLVTDASLLNGKTFDFVIAGGGVAGLALAARLTEFDNLTVAVIEAGPTGEDQEFKDRIDVPGFSYLNGLTGSPLDWQYVTELQPDANGTTKSWPRGKVLGGSGATNGMWWVRAAAEEYDAWNTLNPGSSVNWGWGGDDGMQRYMNKAENFTAPRPDQTETFQISYDYSVHGYNGPIQSGYSAYIYDSVKSWVPTWESLGFQQIDGHGGKNRGVSITPITINPANQSRSDSKTGYLDGLPPRSNLVILTGYQATAVTFNGTKDANGSAIASGMDFMATADGSAGRKFSVLARKEVILSGGVVGSPQILQLSGVGPKPLLDSLGIPVVIDLPVGFNLQVSFPSYVHNHISTGINYATPEGTLVWGSLLDAANASAQLEVYKSGDYENAQLTYVNQANGYVSLADITSNFESFASTAVSDLENDVAAMTAASSVPESVSAGYKAQYRINNEWLKTDVGQLEILMTMLGGTTGVGIQSALQHPYSRGTIMIKSTSAFDKPLLNPNYYGVYKDIEILQLGVDFARKLATTSPMSDLMISEVKPGLNVQDEALTTWIKTSSGTEYHPLGTCSMQPKDNGGVVDTNLVVYGTSNLRVVDASIMPLQLSAHLMASTYGIAEKAADLIKAKHVAYIPPPTPSPTSIPSSETASAARSSSANVAAASAGPAQSTGERVVGALNAGALGLLGAVLLAVSA